MASAVSSSGISNRSTLCASRPSWRCAFFFSSLGDPIAQFNTASLLFAISFGVYVVSTRLVLKGTTLFRSRLPIALIGSFVLAALFLGQPPHLSDDIYRYLWEGRAQTLSVNPYAVAPEAFIGTVDDPFLEKVNHPEYSAIYPPLFQLAMRFVTTISYSVLSAKLLMFAFHVLLLLGLVRLLRASELPEERVLLYGWNPLVILEVAGSGHLDVIGACCMVWSVLLLRRGSYSASMIVWGAAIATKWIPGIVLPLYLLILPRSQYPKLVLAGIPLLLASVPFANGLGDIFQSVIVYLQHWEFNAPIYYSLVGFGISKQIAKAILGTICMSSIVVLSFSQISVERRFANAFGVFTLLGAVCHPWYFLWVFAFLPFIKNPAWLVLSGTLFLSYAVLPHYRATGQWTESSTLIALQYVPCALLWMWAYSRRGRAHDQTQRRLCHL